MKTVNLILIGIKAVLLCYIIITYVTIPVISTVYFKLTEKPTVELISKDSSLNRASIKTDTIIVEKVIFQPPAMIGYKVVSIDESGKYVDLKTTGSYNVAIGYQASSQLSFSE